MCIWLHINFFVYMFVYFNYLFKLLTVCCSFCVGLDAVSGIVDILVL